MQTGLRQLDSFMKTKCLVIFSVFLMIEKCILKRDMSLGMTVGVVKCDFHYKVVISISRL